VTIKAYQIDSELRLVGMSLDAVADALTKGDAAVWVDVYAPTQSELARCVEKFQIVGLTRRLLLSANDRPGLFPLKQEMLLTMPVMSKSGAEAVASPVTFLCRDNLLVTVHDHVLWENREASWQESAMWLPGRSTAALVASAMLDLSQFTLLRIAAHRRTLLALEERMEKAPDTINADELVTLRPNLASLSAVVIDQLPAVEALSGVERSYFHGDDARDYVHCALANLNACARAINGLEHRLEGLREAFQMHAQNKTNHRLNTLTSLSAIFMPVTLLASIWGMNFTGMPELGLRFGYPLGLATMVLVAGGMFVFFRRGGFFE
jgi:magnesium transporter